MALNDQDKAEVAELLTVKLGEALAPALKDLEVRFGKMANGAAITAAEKAVKGLRDKLESVPTAEALEEKLNARIEEMQKAAPQGGDKAKEGQGGGGDEALKKQVQELQTAFALSEKKRAAGDAELAKERAARAEDEKKQKRAEERNLLNAALEKAGVKAALRPAALALLIERGAVKRDEEGHVVFEHKDVEHASTDLLPVEAGVGKWIGTDEGKEYLPPKDAGGSGERGAGRGASGKAVDQNAALKEKVLAGLRGG